MRAKYLKNCKVIIVTAIDGNSTQVTYGFPASSSSYAWCEGLTSFNFSGYEGLISL